MPRDRRYDPDAPIPYAISPEAERLLELLSLLDADRDRARRARSLRAREGRARSPKFAQTPAYRLAMEGA